MNNETLIVRRHPAIARGYERGSEDIEVSGMRLYDLTSTNFEWYKETPSYKMLKEEELNSYIDYIVSSVKENRILVVSSHQVVKNRLDELGYKTLAVYPNRELFKDFSREMEKRENKNSEEIDYVNRNWFPFVTEIAHDTANSAHIEVFDPKLTLLELLGDYIAMGNS